MSARGSAASRFLSASPCSADTRPCRNPSHQCASAAARDRRRIAVVSAAGVRTRTGARQAAGRSTRTAPPACDSHSPLSASAGSVPSRTCVSQSKPLSAPAMARLTRKQAVRSAPRPSSSHSASAQPRVHRGRSIDDSMVTMIPLYIVHQATAIDSARTRDYIRHMAENMNSTFEQRAEAPRESVSTHSSRYVTSCRMRTSRSSSGRMC